MKLGELEPLEIILLAGGSFLGVILLLLAASLVWNGIQSGSLLAVTWILLGAVLAWPVYGFYRGELWKSDMLRTKLEGKKPTLVGTVILAVLTAIAFRYGLPLDSILLLPLRVGGGALYAAVLPYRDVIGTGGGLALMNLGQWTLQLIWVYLIADVLAGLWERFG